MLPKVLKESGVDGNALTIEEDAWALIVRPIGYDAGIRTLQRTIEGIARKVAKMIVEGKGQSYKVTAQNIKEFLPQ